MEAEEHPGPTDDLGQWLESGQDVQLQFHETFVGLGTK